MRRFWCAPACEQALARASKLPLPGGLHLVRPIFVFSVRFLDIHSFSPSSSKTPGTEDGVLEPIPTFSTCYSAPFIVLPVSLLHLSGYLPFPLTA